MDKTCVLSKRVYGTNVCFIKRMFQLVNVRPKRVFQKTGVLLFSKRVFTITEVRCLLFKLKTGVSHDGNVCFTTRLLVRIFGSRKFISIVIR